MPTREPQLWAVYRSPKKGTADEANVVCEQAEWDRLAAEKPGQYALIRDRIASEGEAERLARGTSGDRHRPGAGPSPKPSHPAYDE